MLKTFLFLIFILNLMGCASLKDESNSPTAARIHSQLALAYLEQQDVVHAKQKMLLAQKEAPKDAAVWSMTGYFFEKTGQMQAAQKAYLQSIYLAKHPGAARNNYGT